MSALLIDAGNTLVKWAVTAGDVWSQSGVADSSGDALQRAFAGVPSPRCIIVSNVAGARMERMIRQACVAWPCPIDFVVARAEQCGVRNAYDRPEQLGADRWAALIAAWTHELAACLVVNCGTATTVDALSEQGEFLGGLILPGIDMMRQSLAVGTAQLKAEEGNWRELPRNSADAIYSGAVKATVGAIRAQHRLLNSPGAHCLLAGGAADKLSAHLQLPLVRMDGLVLKGLHRIGQESGLC